MKKTGAFLASFMMLIGMVSCSGEKPAASESASSAVSTADTVSAESQGEKVETFAGIGIQNWNYGLPGHANKWNDNLYFVDTLRNTWVYHIKEQKAEKIKSVEKDGNVYYSFNVFPSGLYGVETAYASTPASAGDSSEQEPVVTFANLWGNPAFQPVELPPSFADSSAVAIDGKLYGVTRKGIEQVDLTTGEASSVYQGTIYRFFYDEEYLYFTKGLWNEDPNLYRISHKTPGEEESFRLDQNGAPQFTYQGVIYLWDSSQSPTDPATFSQVKWGGSAEPAFSEIKNLNYIYPFQGGFVFSISGGKENDELVTETEEKLLDKVVTPATFGDGIYCIRTPDPEDKNGDGEITGNEIIYQYFYIDGDNKVHEIIL